MSTSMTVTFLSNYINHHQIPFSNACYGLLKENYHFVQTEPMEAERLSMGWNREGEKLPYVHCLYEEEELCRKLILESDVLLAGWTDQEELIGERLRSGKLTVRISERLYREGQWKAISPRGLLAKYKDHTRYRKQPVYLLCAGAYVPSDFHLVRAYPDKMFKWGYFPETRHYSREQLSGMKLVDGKVHIVWAGRFIPLKHPESMLQLAENLAKERKQHPEFPEVHIHMIGSGQMEETLREQAEKKGLASYFTFYGFQTPEQVRDIMEKCHIHVFTSNHLEGWGAVVNEAMNSGCAVVANVQAGAVPYLIEHGKNGMVYPGGSFEKMEEAVRFLIQHPVERTEMGVAAYETVAELWNADHAAGALINFLKGVMAGSPQIPDKGPLSKAPVVAPGKMYGRMLEDAKRRQN